MDFSITNISFGLSLTSIGIMLKLSYRVGRFLAQFDALQSRVTVHDKLLGIPVLDGSATVPSVSHRRVKR